MHLAVFVRFLDVITQDGVQIAHHAVQVPPQGERVGHTRGTVEAHTLHEPLGQVGQRPGAVTADGFGDRHRAWLRPD